ncbi:MAG: exo-alpha-sialidase [Candidatus Competibacteraceae bacterium]|nr:exo-alpha-sialidase [Candidatus Competibacteraceae bacterium]
MKQVILLFVFLGLLMDIAHAEMTVSPNALNRQPLNQNADQGYILDPKGGLWLAYYGNDSFLYVQRPDGSEVKLGAQDRERYQSGLALDAWQDELTLLWRDKSPQKTLYLLPHLTANGPAPSPVVVGGDESEPLTRLKVARRDDAIYLLWLGEKPDLETKQRYHLYFRYSEDGGKTFSDVERVLPGIYPMWIVDQGSIAVFSWSWVQAQNRHVMVMRRFDRAGKTFGPMVEIAETPDQISPIYRTFESAGRWFVLWLAQHGDGKDFLLEGAYSEDKGQSWKHFAFNSIKGLDLSHLVAATDGKGHLALAVSGSRSLRDDNPNAKNDVYFMVSSDNGTTWSEPRRFRAAEHQMTHARFPALSFGSPPGTLVMAWEDWRDIRPNIYVAYSIDYGVTWQKEIPLGPPGRVNLAMEFKLDQALSRQGEDYHLVVKRFENDAIDKANLVDYSFTLADLKQPAVSSPALELEKAHLNEERLRQRATQYWDAMQREDYATTYALMDSFFQSQVDRPSYLQKMGTIKYQNFRIEGIERHGKVAKLQTIVEAGVPEFKSPTSGKSYSKPQQPYAFIDTWLFIAGDWYREYNEESSGKRYTQY